LLKDELDYEMVEGSVLDASWIDKVIAKGNRNVLLLAEGLFMYLPQNETISLLKVIGQRFDQSQIVMDLAPAKYTKGIWKWIIQLEARITLGLDLTMNYGVQNVYDIETYSKGYKVLSVGKGTIGQLVIASINAT
jgi:O-methyltransferase involved in polyketide biosynthesis